MMKLKLTQGKYALVDDEDYFYLKRFNWTYASIEGIERIFRNLQMFRGRANISIEDFILSRPMGKSVLIHKDGNRLNLQKDNLDYVYNEAVRHKGRKEKGKYSSDYKGVSFNKKGNNWRIQIEKGKRGTEEHKLFVKVGFKTEEEAGKAWNEKAKEFFGEYADQNIIN